MVKKFSTGDLEKLVLQIASQHGIDKDRKQGGMGIIFQKTNQPQPYLTLYETIPDIRITTYDQFGGNLSPYDIETIADKISTEIENKWDWVSVYIIEN